MERNSPKPHLLALSETHLTRTVKELSLGGYTLVSRLDRRDGRKQGGIALFASPKLADCTTLLEHASDDTHERSWHVLQGDFGPVVLCVWYRPPTSGEVLSISAFEAEWMRLNAGYIGIIVVGDLNLHHKHLLIFSANVCVEGTRLFRFCQENGFRQLVKEATHEAGHLLDLGLTDMVEIERARVLPRVADHNIVRFVMNLSALPQAQRGRRVYEYNRAPWQRICEELGDRDWSWIRFF